MKTITYPCFYYRQRTKSPLQVGFVAHSHEIDGWARVPTKRTGNVRNFQRAAITQHVREVQRFFQDQENASPTAVVIGFDPIRADGKVHLLTTEGKALDPSTVEAGSTVTGQLRMEWSATVDADDPAHAKKFILGSSETLRTFLFAELKDVTGLTDESLSALEQELTRRLIDGAPPLSAGGTTDTSSSDDATDDADDENDDDDGTGDMSPAMLSILGGLSPSERQIAVGRLEFLAQTSPELLRSETDEGLRDLAVAVQDELKPGILIDGQHRVMGTKKSERIPFLVCALPNAQWPELAFQFIVTNRTAKRVQESLLINIVGNSLSKRQRSDIEDRLRDAGIRVGLIEAVMKVHEDETSPFYGLLAFGLRGETGFLDAAAVRNKVIKFWYERKGAVGRLFDHLCEGKLKRDRVDFWKSEDLWFELMIAFWSAVQQRYDGSAVFSSELADATKKTPVSRLMTATVLKIFQETICENIFEYLQDKQQKENIQISKSLPNAEAFSKYVAKTLQPLTPEFFTGWSITGFDGSAGARDDLVEAIEKVIEHKQTVSQLKQKPHRLYKEQT